MYSSTAVYTNAELLPLLVLCCFRYYYFSLCIRDGINRNAALSRSSLLEDVRVGPFAVDPFTVTGDRSRKGKVDFFKNH